MKPEPVCPKTQNHCQKPKIQHKTSLQRIKKPYPEKTTKHTWPVRSSRDMWTVSPSFRMARLASPNSGEYPSSKDMIGSSLEDPETRPRTEQISNNSRQESTILCVNSVVKNVCFLCLFEWVFFFFFFSPVYDEKVKKKNRVLKKQRDI